MKGRNILMLFTNDDRLYICEEKDFANLTIARGKWTEVPMKELTDSILGTDDLRDYLKLSLE